MTDTRAVARLPNLDIEIEHREAPEERAEYLSIKLRATPGFGAWAALFDPLRFATPWLTLNPFLAWQLMVAQSMLGRTPGITSKDTQRRISDD